MSWLYLYLVVTLCLLHYNKNIGDYAAELNAMNFDEVLKNSPSTFAVVLFFVDFCRPCRNYKPQYEKVARLFNGADAVHPGIISVTKVDCALQINAKLCARFSVHYYPMLLWGLSSKFDSWEPDQVGDVRRIEARHTADALLRWINLQIGTSFSLHDQNIEGGSFLTGTLSSWLRLQFNVIL
ncbi:hypothetical protein L6164_018062 [Bauhinia variegata]|uniref:Uncharacterized protein n=1 Tax=Bauhinia variegata TaxID=167791 RepID=A0ACB9NBC9_BAUVA|nr:hypothetical protein L6164_018062 [Bauhinia variegata]